LPGGRAGIIQPAKFDSPEISPTFVKRTRIRSYLFKSNNTSDPGWIGVAFLSIFCSGLAYIAWYDALKALTAAQTGVFPYIEPLVAIVVALFVLNEPITPASLIGGAVILFGVWLVNKS